ncbi:class A beta-lactamase [Streptomyces purpurogeneiscleroticus]|uniref:class A beta-lactamase n=1 Tax=Streptomyces purpurogeneiscleroticus TaxID=68259 RepID=UPI001CBA807E|nr:class A beta-lactamase [Streptomyces purpurogeneiscleroticus]MBZ4016338.1 class A beta-lactamase [Streptomyces purpurogeneiscleroticus]
MTQVRPSRRTVLALGAGSALAVALPACGTATAQVPRGQGLSGQFKRLEREHDARLGVFARDLATGRTVRYRADERFPMCSVFKGLAAAAVLRDLDHNGEFLAERIHYTKKYVTDAGYAPISSEPENVAHGMTVAELCAAAVSHSDNGAANLLLRELGGPTAITRFCRSLGDEVSRLDRWEPQLNSAEPWRTTDTTSPRAIGTTYGRLVVGRALAAADRKRLKDWLIANTTNTKRFRAGLPEGWITADKTGGGSEYGVANDVGVAWPPGRSPVLLSVLSTTHAPEGPSDDALVAKAAELVAAALV